MRAAIGPFDLEVGGGRVRVGRLWLPDGLHLWWGTGGLHLFWHGRPHLIAERELTRQQVARNQRGRRRTVVADVLRLSLCSRRAFYEHFASIDDCLRQAHAEIAVELQEAA